MAKNTTDFQKLKPAGMKVSYTQQELIEFSKCMKDPLYFMENHMYIQHPTRGRQPFTAYEFQRDLVKTYWQYKNTVAMIPRQSGKALSLDTPIPTPSGWTTMGDIKVGDQILGATGKPTTVTFATEIMYDRKCYQVKFDNGEIVVADAEHLWEVTSSYWSKKRQTRTTEEIWEYLFSNPQENRRMYIETGEAVELPEQELLIKPYTLGVWLGDGNSYDGRYTQSVIDDEEISQFIQVDGYTLSKPRINSTNSHIRTIYGIRPLLRQLGVLKNKHIPQSYLRGSIQQRLELLQGLMDTDGSIDPGGHCEFYQKNETLILQVRELLSSLGIKSRHRKKTVNGQIYNILVFTTNTFDVVRLNRKLTRLHKAHNHPKNTRLYITDIIPVESVPVRCIQVSDERHLFLCGKTMVPTHNTTTAAGYLLWYAMFHDDVTVLIAANKFKAASEIMMRIKYAYEEMPNTIRCGVVEYNVTSIRFDNGSRIVATTTTPDSGRGMSISLLYLDEFAFVKPRVASEFWTAMSPTLATGGKCIITSTPASDEDMFAQIWLGAINTIDERGNERPDGIGVNGFKSFSAHYSDVPGRDDEWAETERAKIGAEKFQREYECIFAGEESTLISSMALQRMRGVDPIYRTADVRWYEKPAAGKTYLVSLDPSQGVGKDYAAIEVWSLPDMVQVAEWTSNRTPIPQQVRILQNTIAKIHEDCKKAGQKGEPEIYYTFENNTMGEAALQTILDIGEENFQGQLLNEPRKTGMVRIRRGLNTNGRTKAAACAKLKSLIESNKLHIRSKMLVKQLKFFVATGDGFKAKTGEHDDCVMSTILCVRLMQMVTNWDDRVGELMRDVFDDTEGEARDPLPFSIMIN
jgi:hypothetical protein